MELDPGPTTSSANRTDTLDLAAFDAFSMRVGRRDQAWLRSEWNSWSQPADIK